jgi:ATP-dependent DNA helicase RecQ
VADVNDGHQDLRVVTEIHPLVLFVDGLPRTMSALTISGPPPAVDAASAVRAKDLLYRTALAPGVSFTGPVLLVDNTIRTRWTATVAAALLADAGATSVLPLAIHQLP